MHTFQRFEARQSEVPAVVTWYLADLEEARGKLGLFRRQSPQTLEALSADAIIESAVSSNRIEGVTVDPARVQAILFGESGLRDRNEEEVRGYWNALQRVYEGSAELRISNRSIQELHRLARGGIGDAVEFKTRDSDIIERYESGAVRVRFRPVSAAETPEFMQALVEGWNRCLPEGWVHPLIALGAFSLDFLCVHPFRDGNGRLSRLLLLLQSRHLGFDVGRYVSLERIIEQNEERYFETLEIGSHGWHHGKHDPWPYIGYVLFILKEAYRELEERGGPLGKLEAR